MYKEGLLKDSDIYANIADIIDGTKPGRESDDEICYFNSIGLSFVDVSVAYSFYKKVLNNNLGKDWNIQKTDVTDALLDCI